MTDAETAAAFAALGGTLRGSELLTLLHAAAKRYVIFPSAEAADAWTLWVAATHAQDAWESATRLVIKSPEKRCGKSRLLDLTEAACCDPLMTVNISAAALVRSIGANPPTLLLDEADTVFGRKSADPHEDLRGILNAGHQRNRPYIRWDATARARELCQTFAMAALAGIGDLPDTIEDRAVVIRMQRRGPGETVQPFRIRRDAGPLQKLGARIGAWVRDHLEELKRCEPDLPVEDRAADNWEPLVAVADLAGGDWPARARAAAVALTSDADRSAAEVSLGLRLLGDLREVFGPATCLYTATILEQLYKAHESPWLDYHGHALNERDLAAALRPYGVRSRDVREGGTGQNRKGYQAADLRGAWDRYVPRDKRDDGDSAAQPVADVAAVADVAGHSSSPATRPTSAVAAVAHVADNTPEQRSGG